MKITVLEKTKQFEELKKELKTTPSVHLTETKITEVLKKNILEISVNCSKCAVSTRLTPSDLGLIGTTDENNQFIKEYVKNEISFFPKTKLNKIISISQKARILVRSKSISHGIYGQYIPRENFKEIQEEFEKINQEYELEKEELIKNLTSYKDMFSKKLDILLNERKVVNKKVVKDRILNRFPTKIEIERNFFMFLNAQVYPVLIEEEYEDFNTELLEEVKKGYNEKNKEVLNGIKITLMNNLFEKCESLYWAIFEKDDYPTKTVNTLSKVLTWAEGKNIYVNDVRVNVVINKIKKILTNIDDVNYDKNKTDLSDTLYLVNSMMLGYAKSMNLDDKINVDKLEREELIALSELLEK